MQHLSAHYNPIVLFCCIYTQSMLPNFLSLNPKAITITKLFKLGDQQHCYKWEGWETEDKSS